MSEQQVKQLLKQYFAARDNFNPRLAKAIEIELRKYVASPVTGQTSLSKSCEMMLAATESDAGTSATTKA